MSVPKSSTVKRLFAVSGNQCAFPRCPLPLVDESSGKVTGRICHIKAQKTGGPRYDQNQTDEERHAFENLLILCPIHHDVIDSDIESYSVARLLQIKAEHEKANISGNEPSDDVTQSLINISFSESSLLLSQNQSGGQVAHQITNLLLSPETSASYEREIQSRRDAHDVEIFRRADSILSEDQLEPLFSDLLCDHSYRNNYYLAVIRFCDFFEKTQNQYLNSNLQSLSLEILEALRELYTYLMYNFFVYPENQSYEDNVRLCLYPDLNIDRASMGRPDDMGKYDKYSEELRGAVNKASVAYTTYRMSIKETLFI